MKDTEILKKEIHEAATERTITAYINFITKLELKIKSAIEKGFNSIQLSDNDTNYARSVSITLGEELNSSGYEIKEVFYACVGGKDLYKYEISWK